MPDNNFSNAFWSSVKQWCPFAFQRFANSNAASVHDFFRGEGLSIISNETGFEIVGDGIWVGCVGRQGAVAIEAAFLLLEERLTGKV